MTVLLEVVTLIVSSLALAVVLWPKLRTRSATRRTGSEHRTRPDTMSGRVERRNVIRVVGELAGPDVARQVAERLEWLDGVEEVDGRVRLRLR